MSPLPLINSKKLVKALEKAGFKIRGTTGSHAAMTKKLKSGRTLTAVAVLGKKEIPRGTLKGILAQAELTEKKFREYL